MKNWRIYFLIVVSILWLSASLSRAEATKWEKVTDETDLRKVVVDKSQLKNPFSAKFKNVKFRMVKEKDNVSFSIWCGEVNAQNSYGDFLGWNRFVASDKVIMGDNNVLLLLGIAIDDKAGHKAYYILNDTYCQGAEE